MIISRTDLERLISAFRMAEDRLKAPNGLLIVPRPVAADEREALVLAILSAGQRGPVVCADTIHFGLESTLSGGGSVALPGTPAPGCDSASGAVFSFRDVSP